MGKMPIDVRVPFRKSRIRGALGRARTMDPRGDRARPGAHRLSSSHARHSGSPRARCVIRRNADRCGRAGVPADGHDGDRGVARARQPRRGAAERRRDLSETVGRPAVGETVNHPSAVLRRPRPDGGHAWPDPDRASQSGCARPRSLRRLRDGGHPRKPSRCAPRRGHRGRAVPADPALHAPSRTESLARSGHRHRQSCRMDRRLRHRRQMVWRWTDEWVLAGNQRALRGSSGQAVAGRVRGRVGRSHRRDVHRPRHAVTTRERRGRGGVVVHGSHARKHRRRTILRAVHRWRAKDVVHHQLVLRPGAQLHRSAGSRSQAGCRCPYPDSGRTHRREHRAPCRARVVRHAPPTPASAYSNGSRRRSTRRHLWPTGSGPPSGR